MKRTFKTLAGMAVCALGALALSSCTKDEFFGLEDSITIDPSTKLEIAMSQEFADLVKANLKFTESFSQEVDTAKMNSFCIEGKTVYYKDDSFQKEMLELLDVLKKTYPELKNADKADFDEMKMIALTNNEELSDIAQAFALNAGTKSWDRVQSVQWIRSAYYNLYGYNTQLTSMYYYDWHICFSTTWQEALWDAEFMIACGEGDCVAGGLLWGDNSGASMINLSPEGNCVWWPDTSWGNPQPEADFIILPSFINQYEINTMIPGFNTCGRSHYIFANEEMMYCF